MKNLMVLFLSVAILGFVTSCSNSPKGEKAEATAATGKAATASAAAKTYTVDTEASSVTWTGSKTASQHMGTIKLSGGTLSVKDGNLEAGTFTIDMNSIVCTDIEDEGKRGYLESHLKGLGDDNADDFFNVRKYPTSTFTITKVEAVAGGGDVTHNITGDLKMKDITKSITFGANVAAAGNMLSAVTPSFKVNRTEWGITYKSGTIGTLADNLINDDMALVINLQAK